jgi:hypothetical protein
LINLPFSLDTVVELTLAGCSLAGWSLAGCFPALIFFLVGIAAVSLELSCK